MNTSRLNQIRATKGNIVGSEASVIKMYPTLTILRALPYLPGHLGVLLPLVHVISLP